jgi:hypothetical protein
MERSGLELYTDKTFHDRFISIIISKYGCGIQHGCHALNFFPGVDGSYYCYELYDGVMLPGTMQEVGERFNAKKI